MISTDEALKVHELLINRFGGSHGVRDERSLDSALKRPFATFDQIELYPQPIDKAAAVLESVITNHPFVDGNKRTAYVLARLFLLTSGLDIKTSQEEKYEMVMAVSKGEWGLEQVKNWLQSNVNSSIS